MQGIEKFLLQQTAERMLINEMEIVAFEYVGNLL